MSSPFMRRLERRGTGHHGQVAEKRKARAMGALRVPGSGSIAGAKGDLKLEDFLLESKATINASFSIKQTVLQKIGEEALNVSRKPALAISFTHPDGTSLSGGEYILLRQADFMELLECRSSKKP